jgi:dihydropteroate synthase
VTRSLLERLPPPRTGPARASRLLGVLNVTPDSFADGGRFAGAEEAAAHGALLVEQGAAAIDIGGESTRPGHQRVPAAEQLRRVLPVLARLRPRTAVPISIDTTDAEVAAAALDAGADWVNDTLALRGDSRMGPLIAARRCPVVLMHRCDPARTAADGEDVIVRIERGLRAAAAGAEREGIGRDRILLDPGIGFGTLPADGAAILAGIDRLAALGYPLVVGPSRKSFLGWLTGKPVHERLMATAATVAVLALAGVDWIRVHDVKELRDVLLVADAVRREQQG